MGKKRKSKGTLQFSICAVAMILVFVFLSAGCGTPCDGVLSQVDQDRLSVMILIAVRQGVPEFLLVQDIDLEGLGTCDQDSCDACGLFLVSQAYDL